jgi:hypothetical protein
MGQNVLISKKLDRDIGNSKKGGVHLRPNLKAIIAVEALIENEGWLNEPEIGRPTFENMDKSESLTAEMTEFWFRCGQNKEAGIKSILRNEPVEFKDVLATHMESDSKSTDLKTMIKQLPNLISEIPETNQTKGYISELFKNEIAHSKTLNRVTEFFSLVCQIVDDSKELTGENSDSSDSECDENVL